MSDEISLMIPEQPGRFGVNVHFQFRAISCRWAKVKDPQDLYDKVPFNRLIQPRDVGALCVYLAGPKATHISGQVIFLDCGIGPGSLRDFVGTKA